MCTAAGLVEASRRARGTGFSRELGSAMTAGKTTGETADNVASTTGQTLAVLSGDPLAAGAAIGGLVSDRYSKSQAKKTQEAVSKAAEEREQIRKLVTGADPFDAGVRDLGRTVRQRMSKSGYSTMFLGGAT